MATKVKENKETLSMFIGRTVRDFGLGLWKTTEVIGMAVKCANTEASALKADADIKALKQGLYYQNGTYGLQMVVAYGDGSWGYASLLRDKDGDPITDEDDTYEVRNVIAEREYIVPGAVDKDGNPVKIAKGFETTKAVSI